MLAQQRAQDRAEVGGHRQIAAIDQRGSVGYLGGLPAIEPPRR